MVKKAILLLSAAACISGAANAQKYFCGTDEHHRELIERNPKVAEIQQALDMYLKGVSLKTTGTAEDYLAQKEAEYQAEVQTTLYIPVVVHVIHNYGTEYVADTSIFRMIRNLNVVYKAQNTDLNDVIAPYISYVGNMNIELRLAQKDPQGNPTTGITRHRSNTTYGGDDQAKLNQWDPQRYMNIWIENVIGQGAVGGTVLAYATLPAGAAAYPYSDGVMVAAPYINSSQTKTIEHEMGHYFNLYHPWNSSQKQAGEACGDDEVDDTPPTKGHFSTCPLYDTVCAKGYAKVYIADSVGADTSQHFPVNVTVDYPDTTNVQNIMDYSSCVTMFTKQQVMRARATLRSPVAGRQNLTDSLTHEITGITGPKNDLAPIADYSIYFTTPQTDRVFLCANEKSFTFMNRSWRDTIVSSAWEFPNGTPATSSSYTSVAVTINQPGWVNAKLTVTGNNTGSSTIEKTEAYAADPVNTINPLNGYYEEFTPGGDLDKYPIFNYANNSNKWQVNNNAGYYDNTSMQYSGYDDRIFPANAINTPNGDWDDFFTPAFDLSGMTSGDCNLNFMYAGAYRTSDVAKMKDVLEIHYSTTCGETWVKMDSLKNKDLANKGTLEIKFAPQWTGDWNLRSINIPDLARKEKVFFRFRYKAYGDGGFNQKGVGNNFYLDRLNVSSFPLGMNTILAGNQEIGLVPNPTTGNAYIVIKNNANTNAKVQVTDITGKVVYRTEQNMSGSMNRIEIPASALVVKGMYMVQVITGNEVHTEKLVSY